MNIDIESLRRDLANDCYGAYFGAGIGGALMEAFEIENLGAEELVEFARRQGVDLTQYER